MKRRQFLYRAGQWGLGVGLIGAGLSCKEQPEPEVGLEENDPKPEVPLFFNISLAQWSLHRSLQDGKLDNLDFAKIAREQFGVDGVEYVNSFFREKAQDQAYLSEMKKRAADHGVQSLLIMVDGEGNLGDTDVAARQEAVENHFKWVDAAQYLGCHSIRVNAAGEGSREEVGQAATEGLQQLCEYAGQAGLNVLVENHGGYSSDAAWLAAVIRETEMPNCGTLPDFGNFCLRKADDGRCLESYDPYQGVAELMPLARAVSAKSYAFGPQGLETTIDYDRMLGIVKEAGYSGWVGIEYEGEQLSESEGILATKQLLERFGRRS